MKPEVGSLTVLSNFRTLWNSRLTARSIDRGGMKTKTVFIVLSLVYDENHVEGMGIESFILTPEALGWSWVLEDEIVLNPT